MAKANGWLASLECTRHHVQHSSRCVQRWLIRARDVAIDVDAAKSGLGETPVDPVRRGLRCRLCSPLVDCPAGCHSDTLPRVCMYCRTTGRRYYKPWIIPLSPNLIVRSGFRPLADDPIRRETLATGSVQRTVSFLHGSSTSKFDMFLRR